MAGPQERSEVPCADSFGCLPDALVLQIFAGIPNVEDQQLIAQTCKRFRALAKQIPVLHIHKTEVHFFLDGQKRPTNGIGKAISAREQNTLKELIVQIEEFGIMDERISRWLASCSSTLEVLVLEDDLYEKFNRTDINLRLKCASALPALRSLDLSGSCRRPLDPSFLATWHQPSFQSLQDLTLDKLGVGNNEVLQNLIAACPKLCKLHLSELWGIEDVDISSPSLEDFLISPYVGRRNDPHLLSVNLATPKLVRASITRVVQGIQIQSTALQSLTLEGSASCKFDIEDLSNLLELALIGSRSERRSEQGWSIHDILSLVTPTPTELRHVEVDIPLPHPFPGASHEKLWTFFKQLGPVKKLELSAHFLEHNEFDIFCVDRDKQSKMLGFPVLQEVVEVSISFNIAAKVHHSDYVRFFLETCCISPPSL